MENPRQLRQAFGLVNESEYLRPSSCGVAGLLPFGNEFRENKLVTFYRKEYAFHACILLCLHDKIQAVDLFCSDNLGSSNLLKPDCKSV